MDSRVAIFIFLAVGTAVGLGLGLGLGLPRGPDAQTLRPTSSPTEQTNITFNASAPTNAPTYTAVPVNTIRFFTYTDGPYVGGGSLAYSTHLSACQSVASAYNYDPSKVRPFACYCFARSGGTCTSAYNLATVLSFGGASSSLTFQSHNGASFKNTGLNAFPGFGGGGAISRSLSSTSPTPLDLVSSNTDHVITGCFTDGMVASSDLTCSDHSSASAAVRMERGCVSCTDYAWSGGFNDVRITCDAWVSTHKYMCFVFP